MPDTLTRRPAAGDLITREVKVTEVAGDGMTFTAIAVPYGEVTRPADFYGFREAFAPGCVEDWSGALVYWRHGEVVGRVTAARETDAGLEVTCAVSDTVVGRDVATLLRDGVVTGVSPGFRMREHTEAVDDETGEVTITHTRVQLVDVSPTPKPTYASAAVTEVREQADKKGTTPVPETLTPPAEQTPAWATELREQVTELDRRVQLRAQESPAPAATRFRTAGALLKAIAAGDDEAAREYTETLARAHEHGVELSREYTGGTTAGAVLRKGWVGDLSRLIGEPVGIRSLFATGQLPAEGNYLEYAILDANTVDVAEQAAEGDDLATGKVTLTTDTARVRTYGGYTELTRQQIERSSVNILDAHLRAMDLAARKRQSVVFRTHFEAARQAQITAGKVITLSHAGSTSPYVGWVGAIIDAAGMYEDQELTLDGLIVGKTVFKFLAGMTDAAGRPLLNISGEGVNAVGEINPKALAGNLAGVTVRPNVKGPDEAVTFFNAQAIRSYTSPLSRLQDENVVNLSKAFSVYFYGALATEIPDAIIPVVPPAGTGTGGGLDGTA